MDYTEYTAVKNKFAKMPNLCDLFKLLSIETWKRMEHAYLKRGMRVYETTITQNLIFTINAFNEQYDLNVDIFEAIDERTNGNDFELIIRFPDEKLEFYAPVQAKKVYRDGRYVSMDHGNQIESLVNYANVKDARPFYLLYNFTPEPLRDGATFSNPLELTGCTLIPADYLFATYYNRRTKRNGTLGWKIPVFDDLNPDRAFGWHELVCPSNSTDLLKLLKSKKIIAADLTIDNLISQNRELKMGFYPLNTISVEDKWENINNLKVPTKIADTSNREAVRDINYEIENGPIGIVEKGISKKEKNYPVYSPKSRIVINK